MLIASKLVFSPLIYIMSYISGKKHSTTYITPQFLDKKEYKLQNKTCIKDTVEFNFEMHDGHKRE